MRSARLIAAACCAWLAVLAAAGSAAGDLFAPIELLSIRSVESGGASTTEQAGEAEQSAVSADGRFVAFRGTFDGQLGIWRRELPEGPVEQVAPGSASLPSISSEGRYVSFTTREALAPEDDHNHAPDVYVRDMDKPCTASGVACVPCPALQSAEEREACPFTLVSAVNGSAEGAQYTYSSPSEEVSYGAFASPRSAMSVKGEEVEVVFQSEEESNLLGPHTPADEIWLRDLETNETRLVSSEYDPATNTDTGVPVPVVKGVGAANSIEAFGSARFGGASISADGSTVAWLGRDVGRQAKLLPGEQEARDQSIDEPLWRRVNTGPEVPTRRVTGNSEPESAACLASGEQQLSSPPGLSDPCQGPFNFREPQVALLDVSAGVNFVPQLDEDGEKVAFLASSPEVAAGEEFGGGAEAADDLYVSNMSEGLTRRQGLQRLTEIAGAANEEEYSPIRDVAISRDGGQVAFTTQRTQFPLGSPSYVSPVAGKLGINELFDADVADGTLTRVTHGFAGEAAPSEQLGESSEVGVTPPAEDGSYSPSFSGDGNTLVFSSTADNLVFGDGNDASDVFGVRRVIPPVVTPQQTVSPPPAPPALITAWQLYASAVPKADGEVELDIDVPGAGTLSVGASGKVPLRILASHAGRAGKSRVARARVALVTRTVASVRRAVPASTDGLERLTLELAPAYRALAGRAAGLYTTIALRFAAAGHPTLSTEVGVTFMRTLPAAHARASAHRPGAKRRRGHR
jgi:hypothetical protein